MESPTEPSPIAPWCDPRLQRTGERPWRKVHLDFHNTPYVGEIGADFDADEFARTLTDAHVDAIVVFAKDMHGWFYFPAERSAAVHPGLNRDLMGEQVRACRAAGIKVYAYYCTTWDNLLAEQHPEWLVVKRDRTTYLPKFDETPQWTALCLRNTDFVDLMLADTADLVRRYDIDGVWYDMPMPIGGECFCARCLIALRGAGLDPLDVEVQRADKQQLLVEWMRRSHELVAELRPGCEVDQNNQTRLGLGERTPYLSNVDIEALPTGGWGYQYYPIDVRYARTFGTAVCGMTGRFQRSWADFGGLKRPEQLRAEVAGIVAQGAQVTIGDQAPPSARLDPAVYRLIRTAYAEVQRREAYLDGAAPVVEAAVVIAGEMLADPGAVGSDTAGRWSAAIAGACELLLEHRVQFDVVDATADPEALSRYRLLVVASSTPVGPSIQRALTDHLDRGGAVITSGQAVRGADGAPWVPGATYDGPSAFTVPFLLPTQLLDDRVASFPYALYQGADTYRLDDGQAHVLATLGEPAFNRTAEHYTSHDYSPFTRATTYPVAWDAGRLGVAAFDLDSAYHDTGYWVYAEVFGALLDRVLPHRLVQTDLPGAVEVSFTRQESTTGARRTMVHLVTAFARRRWGGRMDEIDRPPVLTDVQISIERPDHGHGSDQLRATLAGDDRPVDIRVHDNRLVLTVDRLVGADIIVIE